MAEITRQDLIDDDALRAPGILTEEFQKLLSKLDEIVNKSKEYVSSFNGSDSSTVKLRESTAGLSDEQRVLAQVQQQIASLTAKQSDAYQEQLQVVNNLKQSIKEKTQLGEQSAQSINRESSSINQLRSALDSNRIAYSNLRSEQERNSATGRQLLATIQQQDKSLKELSTTIGQNQLHVGEYKQELAGLFDKLGESGNKINNVFKTIAETAESSFGVVIAITALTSGAIRQFFERTEEGQLQQEIILDQISIRWEIFKNRVAAAGRQVFQTLTDLAKAAEANEEAKEAHRKQRYATATEDQKKQMDLETEQAKRQKDITIEREELFKEETKVITDKSHSQLEAALLLETAYGRGNELLKDRFNAAVKADSILRVQNAEDVAIASKKADLFKRDLENKKGSLGLTLEEQRQVAQTFADVVALEAQFELASRRRITLIARLGNELKKEGELGIDFKGFEQDWAEMLKAIEALNNHDAAVNKKLKDDEKKDEEELTKFLDQQQKTITDNELHQGEVRWENYKKFKKKEEELDKEHLRLEQELERATVRSIESIIQGQFVAQEQNLQNELTILQDKHNEEVAMAGTNAEAKLAIDRKYAKEQEVIHKQILEIKRKEAIFEKAAAILDIAVRTINAVAASKLQASILASNPITAPLASLALAQIPIEIATGAVEAAAVAARPLPSYFIGTKDHPGGPAEIHPNELIEMPTGRLKMSPDHTSIIDLPEHTKVFTSTETTRMLALSGLGLPEKLDKNYNSDNHLIVNQLKQTNQLLNRKVQTSILADGLAVIEVYKNNEGLVKKIRSNVMIG